VREVVQLVGGDVAIPVQIGRTGAQPLHQAPGEDGGRGAADPDDVGTLEGVLHSVGGGEDDAAATAESLAEPDGSRGLGDHATGEGTAVAAVEHQDLAACPALLHEVVHKSGRYAGRAKPVRTGVAGSEVQASVRILDPVPGEVQQDKVLTPAISEERFHGLRHHRRDLVHDNGHPKSAYGGVGEHRDEGIGILDRCGQLL